MMNENDKRMALDDADLEKVTGGNVLFVVANGQAYLYGSHNPDKKYAFVAKVREVNAFISANYDFYGEAGIFDALKAEGLIADM